MVTSLDPKFSPYKGLQPYTENDRAYFFGRERDQEIITANLYASPLTVLYGESGVGKSSVLMAGVAPRMHETPRLALVVYRDWQDAGFLLALKKEVLRATRESTGKEIDVDAKLPFDDFLQKCEAAFGGSIFFILDQFEEYFLYHPVAANGSSRKENFDATLARAINREDIDANFLLSMRDDGLSKLDRFQGRIPNLLNNLLRLEHLDLESAESAVRSPLAEYNKRARAQGAMSIEDSLVKVLLKDLRTGKVTLNLTGQGKVSEPARDDHSTARIETPFLQMVLMRLWDEDRKEGSKLLRLDTYNRLGKAENIVRTHLDDVMEMDKLKAHRDTAASVFHFLVTPTGQKIAHTPGDLVSYTERAKDEVSSVLDLLSDSNVRILRPIAPPPEQPSMIRYEIFHDVLAPAVLDWRARYIKERADAAAEAEAERKLSEERAEAERLAVEQRRQLELAQAQAEEQRKRAEQQAALVEAQRREGEAREELFKAEQQRLREQSKVARRLRRLVIALIAMALFSLAFAVYAYAKRSEAKANEQRAMNSEQVAIKNQLFANEREEVARTYAKESEKLRKIGENLKAMGEAAKYVAAVQHDKNIELARIAEQRQREAAIALTKAEEARRSAKAERELKEKEAERVAQEQEKLRGIQGALALSNAGESLRAVDQLESLLPLFEKTNDECGQANVHFTIGSIYADMALSERVQKEDLPRKDARIKGIYSLDLALQIYEASGVKQHCSSIEQAGADLTRGKLSFTSYKEQEIPEAAPYFQQALKLYRQEKNMNGEISALEALIEAYVLAKDDDKNAQKEVASYREQLLPLYEKGDEINSLAATLQELGWYYSGAGGEKEKALEYYLKWESLFDKHYDISKFFFDNEKRADTLEKIADIYKALGNMTKEREYREKADKIRPEP